MSENTNSFGGTGWGALVGGALGAGIGDGNLFGGNRNTLTTDQFLAGMSNAQNQSSTDAIQAQLNGISGQICSSTGDITAAVTGTGAGIKDSVNGASALNQLALCELGHKMSAGFAAVNQNITIQGYESRLLATQQALDAARALATENRVALTEHKNQAGHNATQVLLQQVVNAGK